jgi:hypothetical protein
MLHSASIAPKAVGAADRRNSIHTANDIAGGGVARAGGSAARVVAREDAMRLEAAHSDPPTSRVEAGGRVFCRANWPL